MVVVRFRMSGKFAQYDRLESVRIPTLVVGGVHDPILTPAPLRDSEVAPLTGARHALLDCNHEVPIEKPLELAGLIEAFLVGFPMRLDHLCDAE